MYSPTLRSFSLSCFGVLALSVATTARADVSLFPLFSEHAVLQASDKVPVWGKADPGEVVTVSLGGDKAKATATAEKDGKWTATLDLKKVGQGPFELVAQSPRNRVAAADVIVGEVWLCSGQSNMEFVLKNSKDGPEEIARSANPMLRQFLVTKNAATSGPVDTVVGKWVVASPETSGTFTAVGYYFGKKLQTELHVPVGLVHSSWGGTPSEAWTSQTGFDSDQALKAGAEKTRSNFAAFEKFKTDYRAWQQKADRKDRPTAAVQTFTAPAPQTGVDGEWKTVKMPTKFTDMGLPDAGAVWLQRIVTLPEGGFGRGVEVLLGDIHGGVDVYWNGKKIGSNEFGGTGARHRIGGPDVKPGDNVLALRIFEPAGGGGIIPGATPFRVDHNGGKISLETSWQAKVEFALPPLLAGQEPPPVKPPAALGAPYIASSLYDGMIAPLVPCAIRGVIWYQGEANAGRAWQYRTAFPLMIKDWRAQWQRGDFPFYFCQLANYLPRQPLPGDSAWAELRDAQTSTLSLPATGHAILIDVGEENDIHPKDKQNPGERLARIALAKDYGQKVAWSGPVLDSFKVEGGKARLKFRYADGGLVATPLPETYKPISVMPQTKPVVRNSTGGPLEGFAVCGADQQWKWATAATIEGDSVVVSCTAVPEPVAVRYAWADNPLCNLANGAGLPAGPFRTDDFKASTLKNQY